MRISTGASLALSLLPGLASAIGFDCKRINVDGVKFDLSPLGGVHSLYHVDRTDEYIVNTTYVLNICNILNRASIRDGLKCGTSKNICGFQKIIPLDGSGATETAFPIVGLDPLGHGTKDPEVTRLKKQDPDAEGLLVKLAGGEYREDPKSKKKDAAAVIEFKCDPDRSGLEGLEDVADSEEKRRRRRDEDGEDGGDKKDGGDEKDDGDEKNDNRSLQFKSFKLVDDTYILRLDWRTRYACENYVRDNPKSGGHWGFFTWLIIIVFLCAAAYLIFGSWLNYNRYGARGWDLLPHSDTIRDIPYIFQDWVRRVVNTLQGPGVRGGYSAV
ncbi:hypothetical protein VTN77DRAFT_9745 [Rasamsonia byssochlamydoides]|uniref:uncharacterized protein n=1 Tax=Rasamsonia byssochlamydoides TaxID=89139 RepID=UPI0037442308